MAIKQQSPGLRDDVHIDAPLHKYESWEEWWAETQEQITRYHLDPAMFSPPVELVARLGAQPLHVWDK